jgi:hypothetical protein
MKGQIWVQLAALAMRGEPPEEIDDVLYASALQRRVLLQRRGADPEFVFFGQHAERNREELEGQRWIVGAAVGHALQQASLLLGRHGATTRIGFFSANVLGCRSRGSSALWLRMRVSANQHVLPGHVGSHRSWPIAERDLQVDQAPYISRCSNPVCSNAGLRKQSKCRCWA